MANNRSNTELTTERLEAAIANFKTENPDKIWEDVDQETRWKYIDAVEDSKPETKSDSEPEPKTEVQ